jgi:spore coat polysaccharide biosynthesis protein SpsF
MAERVQASHLGKNIVVATTTDTVDDMVESLCLAENIPCFRGHPTDLLDRHYKAALKFNADVVVKIPSDCPLIDPAVIDKVLNTFVDNVENVDFVSNLHPATYPDGNDVEVMPLQTLKEAYENAIRPMEREHTTPYIWENPDKFRLLNVEWETGLDYSMSHRWTIDYPDDYAFIKKVYDELYLENPTFGLNAILNLLETKPEIAAINAHYAGVNWYRNHLDELKTIHSGQTKKLN